MFAVKSNNPGLGKRFLFFGKFKSLILARRAEREHPGSFIVQKRGYHYVVKERKSKMNPTFESLYLDDMDVDELMDFWMKTNSVRPIRFAKELFPEQPKGYVQITKMLGHYAANLATAKRLRLSGNIERAMEYERIVESIYKKLPTYAKPNPERKRNRWKWPHITRYSQYRVNTKRKAKGTLIYGRVLKIYAQKTSGPYKGQNFVHTFKRGAIMMGMPDGSIRISHP